jgi:LacI family transcriptional regulator
MNYLPGASTVALSHHERATRQMPSTTSLAWWNLWLEAGAWRQDDESLRYWQAAFTEAERLGYRLEEFNSPSGLSSDRLPEHLSELEMVGVLVPPGGVIRQNWADSPWPRLPMVQLGNSHKGLRAPFVAGDDVNNGFEAFTRVWKHRYRRIGLLLDPKSSRSVYLQAGFLHAQSIQPDAFPLPPLAAFDKPDVQFKKNLEDWFRQYQPDAVVLEHLELLRRLGTIFELPRNTGIALLDVHKGTVNSFAGIRRNVGEIGRVAVQMLASQIHDHPLGFPSAMHHFSVEGTWLDGPSLPPRE